MAIPFLLLAYKRPKNTREIFDLIVPDTRVYLFVDHDEILSDLNRDAKNLAKELDAKSNVSTQIQQKNLGPGKAMIMALDWAFESEEMLVILEDDVFPNSFYADYINSVVPIIGQHKKLNATMRSPITEMNVNAQDTSGISKFALTNGWLLTRETWIKFKIHTEKALFGEFFNYLVRHPLSIRREHFFFYAAALLSRDDTVSAWDTQFVFFCLIKNIRTLTPNKSCIEIRGVDEVASNTIPLASSTSDLFWRADDEAPAREFALDSLTQKFYDKMILEKIYHVRLWHFFSPIKSYLRILKKRFVQFNKSL